MPGAGRAEYSGNGWLLREERGVIHAMTADGRVIRGKRMNGDDPMPGGEGGLQPVQIQPANLDADLKVFSEALKPKAAAQYARNENAQAKSRNAGGALLFLAQLQRQGRADFVREMLPQVLASMPSPELALDGAVSLLADAQLAVLAHQWVEKGDASAYAAAIGNLVATFPRGWGNREAASLLAAKLRSQAPSPLATENDARIAAALLLKLKPAEFQQLPVGQNWFIQGSRRGRSFGQSLFAADGGSDEDQPPGKPAKKNAEVAAFFKNKRAAAIALAKLLDDHRYLRVVAREDGNNFNNRRYSSGGHQSHEAVLRAQYDQLSRPSELGEFAWTLLVPLLPEELRDAAGEKPEARAASALAWLKSVAGKSDEELAWEYLRNSRATYQDEFSGSLAFLVEKGGPETLAELREVFLDPGVWGGGSMDEVLAEVEKYMRRAPADPAFAEKLRAAVKAALDAEEMERRSNSQQDANYERQLAATRKMRMKKLEQLFKPPQSVADQLAEIIAMEEPEAVATLGAAAQSFAAKPLAEIEAPILQAAAKAKPAMLKSNMLQLLLNAAMRTARGKPAPAAAAPAIASDPATREALRTLLADETAVPNEYDPANTFTIADMTSWVLLALHTPPSQQNEWQALGNSFPHLAKKWTRTCARAVIAGQPAPPMPSSARLPAGRAATLVAELGALPAAQIPAALDAMTPDEQLAVLEHLQKADTWPASLPEVHFTIREVAGADAAALGGAAWKGRKLDEKFAHEIQTVIENSAATGKFFTVHLSAGEPLAGAQISVSAARSMISVEQFSSSGIPGLSGRPTPVALLTINIQSWRVDDDGEGRPGGFGVVIWKDAAVTRAWREENAKPAAEPKADPLTDNRFSADPAAFEKKLRACLSLQKEGRGNFRVNIFATGIGEPPAAPRARTRVIEN